MSCTSNERGKRPFDCQVRKNWLISIDSIRETTRAMRKLDRSLDNCQRCENYDDCPVLREFQSSFHTAVAELTEELDLNGTRR